ncbi:probable choline kinase 2 isoform X2 [Vigna radiata var. radiata]|uniref:Probable choline kinase 2 isoform X2 n=1 Tax=Vigna radiata var. radiata TaxID=3916 RepID=A0A3Q0FAX0_VIGRR|nr:probable choline kinase 2 isoform X2 [Vigna radiata var. radiata]
MAIKTIELLKGCGSQEEIMEVLAAVASDMGDAIDDVSTLQVIPLKGAMTNEVFQVKWPSKNGGEVRKVLVRLYGEGVEVFFDREEEVKTFECMSKHGQGPRLLGRFTSGRVEEFIHARTLSAADLRDPEVSALVASKMREFHNLHMPGAKKAQIWHRLRNWLGQAKSLCSPKDAKNFGLDNLDEEINILEKKLSEGYQEIGFCHNDLQYGNIMMEEESKLITIIDYEYASYNPIAYDIANHFCEMVADYHSDTPHVLDFKKYPGLEERQRFIRIYLSSEVMYFGNSLYTGNKPSNAKVNQLVKATENYTAANHIFWGLWGLISSYVNKIDFDYKEYARQRFQQYWLRKANLLDSPSIVSKDQTLNESLPSFT